MFINFFYFVYFLIQRQKIKDEIARDREAQKKARETETSGTGANAAATTTNVPASASPSTITQEKRHYDECKIQIRMTDGKSMMQTFKANESLAAVRLWVEMNRTDGAGNFSLMQTFPRKVYGTEDMSRSLSDLGLVPASSLIIQKQ